MKRAELAAHPSAVLVGLTRDVAESYVPMNIRVSYAGQDGTTRPFLMIINWLRVGRDWKVALKLFCRSRPYPPRRARREASSFGTDASHLTY
jgi:hypothetical protein